MARTISYGGRPRGTLAPAGPTAETAAPDEWRDKVVKLIPAEVVAFYVATSAIIATIGRPDETKWWLFGMFVIGLICTPLYLRRATRNDNPGPRPKQYVITTVAFVVWALATSAPLVAIGLPVSPVLSAVILPVFTLVSGVL